MAKKMTYSQAGVNIDKANQTVKKIKNYAKSTRTKNVLSDVGLFGGMFKAPTGYKEPILVASTDGVGTKLKLAYMTGKHDTIGQDLVNHCVNDILVQGAKPLFFLDYIGTGKLEPDTIANIVKGLAKACKENGCALIGGETAEMPGIYNKGEYDLASCIVGVVERKKIIDGKKIKPGNAVIAIASSGLHTNGYSLANKAIFEKGKYKHTDKPKGITGNIGKALMKVHKSYLKSVMAVMQKHTVNGMAHITGGGLIENIPRVLPKNSNVEIYLDSWKVPPIFKLIQTCGNIDQEEMFHAFNMGIGMVLIVDVENTEKVLKILKQNGEKAWLAGHVVFGEGKVRLS